MLENFGKSPLKCEVNIEKLKLIIKDLKKRIDSNDELLRKANQIDITKFEKSIDLEELKNIIDIYDLPINDMSFTNRYIVKYAGDPYLTVHLIMQALIQRCQLMLITDEVMLGVNEVIFAIFEDVLTKYSIKNLFFHTCDMNINELTDNKENIIVIGDTLTYQMFMKKSNIKYYPYNNMLVYCDNDDYIELRNSIYDFSSENAYETEIISEDNLDDAIAYMKNDNYSDIAVFLLNDITRENEIRNELNDKKVYVNENPFKNVTGRVFNYFKS